MLPLKDSYWGTCVRAVLCPFPSYPDVVASGTPEQWTKTHLLYIEYLILMDRVFGTEPTWLCLGKDCWHLRTGSDIWVKDGPLSALSRSGKSVIVYHLFKSSEIEAGKWNLRAPLVTSCIWIRDKGEKQNFDIWWACAERRLERKCGSGRTN